ncbi:hypothetical protein CEXT_20711 [Caerostris extrusa]|uniref:Uncharacterized protein n=1 Tax=Caerostris extrusa TaxID=172846 RepID=A0AAV4Q9W9_CAEEX|nr:hypothetical protein CEXT_20711 [Caerostris extrusa]
MTNEQHRNFASHLYYIKRTSPLFLSSNTVARILFGTACFRNLLQYLLRALRADKASMDRTHKRRRLIVDMERAFRETNSMSSLMKS